MARVREILLPWDSQPQEAVELAPEYFKDSALAFNLTDPYARNFAEQGNGKILTPVNPQVIASPHGRGVGATSDKAFVDLAWGSPIVTSDGAGTGDYLIVGAIHPQPSASRTMILHIRRNADPFNSVLIVANGYYADGGASGINESGSLYFGAFESAAGAPPEARGVKAAGVITGQPIVFAAHRKAGNNQIWVNGVLIASNSTLVPSIIGGTQGISINGWAVVTTLGQPGPTSLLYAANRAFADGEGEQLSTNPNRIWAERSILVPVSVGGGGPTAATITAAAGASTASALTGSATATATITQAAGTSTASMAGASVAAAAITQADGVATASTIAGGLTAVGAITQATGVATAGTMAASAVAVSAFSAAPGAATGETLTGAGLTAGASSITPASGASTASSLAGSSTAASAISPAAGAATASTISGGVGVNIVAASMVPSAGVATASEFAASAVAATVAIASAGASSAQAMAATAQAVADFVAAAGVATAETMVDFDSSVPVLGSLVGSTRKVGMGRPASVSSIARTSRQPLRR